jgi:hypothetical protein
MAKIEITKAMGSASSANPMCSVSEKSEVVTTHAFKVTHIEKTAIVVPASGIAGKNF